MNGMTCKNCAHAYPVFDKSGVCTGIECAASNLRFIPISEADGCAKWTEEDWE